MRFLLKLLTISLIIIIFSCTEEDEPIGKCSDSIELSTENLYFEKKGGTKTVTTSEKFRFGISYNDEDLNIFETTDHLEVIEKGYFTQYIHQDFTIERYEKKIVVKMNENKGTKREIFLSVDIGNCFSGVKVEQEGV